MKWYSVVEKIALRLLIVGLVVLFVVDRGHEYTAREAELRQDASSRFRIQSWEDMEALVGVYSAALGQSLIEIRDSLNENNRLYRIAEFGFSEAELKRIDDQKQSELRAMVVDWVSLGFPDASNDRAQHLTNAERYWRLQWNGKLPDELSETDRAAWRTKMKNLAEFGGD